MERISRNCLISSFKKMCNIQNKTDCPVYGRGVVLDDFGNPVEGAFVSVVGSYTRSNDGAPSPCGWTDSDGQFEIVLIQAGGRTNLTETITIRVEQSLRSLATIDEVQARDLKAGTVSLKLKPTQPVTVKVEDAKTGRPVIGANVINGWKLFVTNGRGEVVIPNLHYVSEGDLNISKAGFKSVNPAFSEAAQIFAEGVVTIKLQSDDDSFPIASMI